MVTRLTIDADLTEEDLRRDLIEVDIPGVGVSTFPGVMPALAVIRVSRWSAAGRTDDLTPAEAIALLGDLVPDEIILEWSRKGLDILDPKRLPVMEQVIGSLLAEYKRRDLLIEAAGPSGKAPVAPMTPPPFSGTGASSSPTAAESTASPFPVT